MCNDEYYGLGERNREKTDKAVIGQDHFFFFSASDRRCNRACIRADCSQTFFFFLRRNFLRCHYKDRGVFSELGRIYLNRIPLASYEVANGVERVTGTIIDFPPIVQANVTDFENAITDSIPSHYKPTRIEITKKGEHTAVRFASKRKYRKRKKKKKEGRIVSKRSPCVRVLSNQQKENKLTIKEQQRLVANFVSLRTKTERRKNKREKRKNDKDDTAIVGLKYPSPRQMDRYTQQTINCRHAFK